MTRIFTAFIIAVCAAMLSSDANAQVYSIKGRVVDENKVPLSGVLVRLVDLSDSSNSQITSSSLDGTFSFGNIQVRSYRLQLTAVGRKDFFTTARVVGKNVDIGDIVMKESAIPLRGVTVEGRFPSAIQNGDTTEYQAKAVKVNRDATMEDLLSKLPGIIVNNGTVTVGGETVQRVLVDGRPYFGDDPTLAIRNLPVEVIDRIQVFDQMSDQAQFTGFDDGQSVKAMNVITRRNGGRLNFGKVTAGYGNDNGRYDAAANINMFNGNSRISLLGSSNNVNQQDFSTQDILGVISNRSIMFTPGAGAAFGGGGPRRANPFGRSGAISSNNQFFGQQSGINNTTMMGTNASDSLATGLFAQGSYFFNRVGNQNDQLDHRQYLLGGDSTSLYDQNSNAGSTNYNNRITGRIDWTADPSNILTILPVLYFQSNRASNLLDATITQTGSNSQSDSQSDLRSESNTNNLNTGYNITAHAIYRHAFDLPGRTISMDFGVGTNQKHTDGLLSSEEQYYGTTDSLSQESDYLSNAETVSGNLIYTEPTDVNAMVELVYNPSFTRNTAYKETYNFNPLTGSYTDFYAPLSNSYADNYVTQKVGIGYRWHSASSIVTNLFQPTARGPMFLGNGPAMRGGGFGTGWNIMVNLSYQYAELHEVPYNVNGVDSISTNTDFTKKFWDFLPSAMINYTSSDRRNLRIFYRTSTTAPAVTQLQQVVDNSNPLLLTTGNPNLSQSYSHLLLARYNLTTPGQAKSMFLLLFATYTQDYIANATIIPSRDTTLSNGTKLTSGSQLTYPVNLNGYWNVRSFFTYGLPFDLISSALNLNAGVTYNRTPGMLNNIVSDANTIGPSAGFVIGSNISRDFDFTISYMGNYNFAMNSQQFTTGAGNYYSHTASLRWYWEFWNGIVLNNQLSSVATSGLASGYNQNILLWNLSLAKKFFANESGELRVTVNDLLGQNKSVSRSVTSSYIDDTQNEVLTRYILVSFSYTLR